MDLLDRKKAIPILIGDYKRFLIISGLAGPAKDIGFLTKESPNTFLFGGAMGGALPTSLGLALSRPKETVLCVFVSCFILRILHFQSFNVSVDFRYVS